MNRDQVINALRRPAQPPSQPWPVPLKWTLSATLRASDLQPSFNTLLSVAIIASVARAYDADEMVVIAEEHVKWVGALGPDDQEEKRAHPDWDEVDPRPWGSARWNDLRGGEKRLYAECTVIAPTLAVKLAQAAKTRRVTDQHVRALLASCGIEGEIRRPAAMASYLAAAVEDVRGDPEFLLQLAQDTWLSYRCRLASTPEMLRDALVDPLFAQHIDDAERATIARAIDRPTDQACLRAIPKRVVAVLAAYLEAGERTPPGWKQGTAARATMAPAQYRRLVHLFKRNLAVLSDQDRINAQDDTRALEYLATLALGREVDDVPESYIDIDEERKAKREHEAAMRRVEREIELKRARDRLGN